MDSQVSVRKDIVLEVSKRLDIDYEKVDYVFSFLFGRYMRVLIRSRNVCTIHMPFLGRLHMKYGYFKNFLNNKMKRFDKYNKTTKMRLLRIQEKLELIDQGLENNDSTCKAHLKNYKIRNKYFTLGKSFEELQKFQNEE